MKMLRYILRPVDWFIAGYQLLMILAAVVFNNNLHGFQVVALRHMAALTALIVLRWLTVKHPKKYLTLISDWYPIVTLPITYRWAGDFIHVIFSWKLDSLLSRFDIWFLGEDPVKILQRGASARFTDLMQLSYCSFFVMIFGSSLILYLKGRLREFDNLRLGIVTALYGTYLWFMLLPAHSLRFEVWRHLKLNGGWVTHQISAFITSTAYCGGAFPSGHAAGSLIICIFMVRYIKLWSLPFIMTTILLLLSTLFGAYHYLADILAGFIHGGFAILLAVWWNRTWDAQKQKAVECLNLKSICN
jgi:membrane-associated phospholipid phosphatase